MHRGINPGGPIRTEQIDGLIIVAKTWVESATLFGRTDNKEDGAECVKKS